MAPNAKLRRWYSSHSIYFSPTIKIILHISVAPLNLYFRSIKHIPIWLWLVLSKWMFQGINLCRFRIFWSNTGRMLRKILSRSLKIGSGCSNPTNDHHHPLITHFYQQNPIIIYHIISIITSWTIIHLPFFLFLTQIFPPIGDVPCLINNKLCLSRRKKQPWICQWAAISTGWPKSSAKSGPKVTPSRRSCRFWGVTSPNYPSSIKRPIRNSTCSSSIVSPNSETAGAASGMSPTSTSAMPGENSPSWPRNTKMWK